jgi:LysR family transcriptional activator of nhaA
LEWLNHHHLLYFWTIANEGSIAAAAEVLHLTPQTISAQIKTLEGQLGDRLFQRAGRGLVLTETGEMVRRYADDIFALSRELLDTVKGRASDRPQLLRVGVADALPKLVCQKILAPALSMPTPVQLVCREDGVEGLLAELAIHRLDLVINDAPMPAHINVKAYNHLLGQCGVMWMATPGLAQRAREAFPSSLAEVPLLLPTSDTALRRSLDLWLERNQLHPRIAGEFVDSALLKAFGEAGAGVFPVADVIAETVRQRYGVEPVGPAAGVTESFYAISVERRVRHPAVAVIAGQARAHLFEGAPPPARSLG